MRSVAALLAVVFAIAASGCMNKPRHLHYSNGVTIVGWHVPHFEACLWSQDPNNPQPCPLVVHLPAGDIAENELADAETLKQRGWEEQGNGNLALRTDNGILVCGYRGRALVAATVSTLPGNGGGPIAVSIGGKRFSLPATDEEIIAALGQPDQRD
jgi:hypothetical protein